MKINNVEYTTPALTFANLCKLEDWGLTVNDMAKRPLGFLPCVFITECDRMVQAKSPFLCK